MANDEEVLAGLELNEDGRAVCRDGLDDDWPTMLAARFGKRRRGGRCRSCGEKLLKGTAAYTIREYEYGGVYHVVCVGCWDARWRPRVKDERIVKALFEGWAQFNAWRREERAERRRVEQEKMTRPIEHFVAWEVPEVRRPEWDAYQRRRIEALAAEPDWYLAQVRAQREQQNG